MKRNKLLIAVLALALPFILSLACGSSGPPAIGDVVMAKGLDANSEPVDVTSTYQPGDTFYVSVKVTDLVVGSTVKVIYKLDNEIYHESTPLTADTAGSGAYNFQLEPSASGHMPGSYTAEVYLDNVLAKTVSFTVEGDAQAQIDNVSLATSVDENKQSINPTTTFSPTDAIHVSVHYKYVKSGAEIKVVLNFAGSDTFKATTDESTSKVDATGSGTIDFSWSPPSDGWATGDYTVEVFLDGTSSGDPISFTVAN